MSKSRVFHLNVTYLCIMNSLSKYLVDSLRPSVSHSLYKMYEFKGALNEDARIQHAEDVIFWEGSVGAKRVLQSFLEIQKQGYKNITIKWDGSPAIVFGRNPSGQFILTDKNGFFAKGYNGKATSGDELEKMFLARGGGGEKSEEFKAFAGQMKSIFSIFESAIPANFRGYFKGDLLYSKTPPIKNGNYVFKPNIVTYYVDINSELGTKISHSVSAVVVHRFMDETGKETAITDFSIFQGEKLLVIPPITIQKAPKVDNNKIKETLSDIAKYGKAIDKMLDEKTLISLKLVDFPDTLYRYINSKVDTGLTNLGKDFEAWMVTGSKLTEVKRKRMLEYIKANQSAFDGLWLIVGNIMSIKDSVVNDIDQQSLPIKAFIGNVPSGEGYVLSHPKGDIKFVSRPIFTAANRAVQRETIANYDFDIPDYQRELKEGGFLKPELTAKTKITPQIVNAVFDNAKKFLREFNEYLKAKGHSMIMDIKILGSARYFQQDLQTNPNEQYGDIDIMFVLPEADSDENEVKVKTLYSKLIVDFVKTSNQNYIDKESAERSGGKQLVVKIDDKEWVQFDLLFTFKKYGDWFSTRFSPQRGVKGFVTGKLYSALAETLNIRIGDRGVRAKLQNGQITNPLLRKGVIDKLISTSPTDFLFELFHFLTELFDIKYTSDQIDSRLNSHKGLNPENIQFTDLAEGIAGLVQSLDNVGVLRKMNTSHAAFIDSIKTKYEEKIAEDIAFKSKKATDVDTQHRLIKIKRDAETGKELVNRLIREFTEQFNEYINESGNAVATNSKVPRQYLESTVSNGLNMYKLGTLKYEIVGNKQKEYLGDIDVATSVIGLEKILGVSYEADKKEFYKKLDDYIKSKVPSNVPQPAYKVMSGLDQLSINVPIVDSTGKIMKSTETNEEEGYAQLDLMIGDVDFMNKALSGAPDSKYKAALRNLLLMSITRYSYAPTAIPNIKTRYQFNWKKGMQKLDVITNDKGKEEKHNIKTVTNNMDDVAVFLFGKNHTFNDINTFEKLFKLMNSNDFRYKEHKNEIITDFKGEIKKLGFAI